MTMEDTQENVQCADLEAGRRTGTLEGQEWREPPVVVESKGAYDEFCLQWFLDHVHPKTNIYRQAGANRGHQKKKFATWASLEPRPLAEEGVDGTGAPSGEGERGKARPGWGFQSRSNKIRGGRTILSS